MWKIQSRQQESPSYVFAVLHHADPAFSKASERMQSVLKSCKYYAGVWPVDGVGRNELLMKIQRADHAVLRKEYRKKAYRPLENLVALQLSDNLDVYASWQPLYLRQILQDAGRSKNQQRFWDEELYYVARAAGLSSQYSVSVHTLSGQIQAIPLEEQLSLLRSYAQRPVESERDLDRLAAHYAYARWNELALDYRALLGSAAAPRLQDGIALMVSTSIMESREAPGGFYAVPAELLGGPRGVFSNLEQLGMSLEPVPLSGFQAELLNRLPEWILKEEAGQRDQTQIPAAEHTEQQNEPISTIESVTEPAAPSGPVETAEEYDIPELDIHASSSHSQNISRLFDNIADLEAMGRAAYIADPFSDLINPLELDTAFLKQWIHFKPRERDFSVRLPFEPQLLTNAYKAEGGIVEIQAFLLNDPASELYLLISRSQYPNPFKLSDPVRFFENAQEGTRIKFNGLVMAERPLSAPLYRGREFVYSLPDQRYLRGRLMLLNNQLYQLTAIGTRDVAWSDEAEIFLRSFSLPRANVRTWAHISGPRFRARMPITPLHGQRTVQTPSGAVDVKLWSLDDPLSKITYFISLSHYPPEVARSRKAFLEQIAEGTAINLNGNIVRNEKISVGRRKGRFVEIHTPEKHYRIRFLLDGSDLHQIMAGGSPDKVAGADVQYYFDSFSFQ